MLNKNDMVKEIPICYNMENDVNIDYIRRLIIMNSNLLIFVNTYLQLLLCNFMIYVVLIQSYKLKTMKTKSYLLAFLYANYPAIIETSLIIYLGGLLTYTKPVYFMIQLNQGIELILAMVFIMQVIDKVWYKIYWWYIVSFFVLSIPNRLYVHTYFTYGTKLGFITNLVNLQALIYYLLYLILILSLGLLLIYISRRISISNKFNSLSKWNWYILYFICSILVWSNNRVFTLKAVTRYNEFAGYIIVTIIILSIATNQGNKKLLLIENSLLNQQKELQYAKFIDIQQLDMTSHKLYHDMGNHINTIQVLLENGEENEAADYIQGIMELYEGIKRDIYCSNKMINTVLNQKRKLCDANGISFQTELNIPEQLPFQDIDLMSIYSELIDVAIKGCMVSLKEDNFIYVQSGIDKDSLKLQVLCNRFDESLLNIDGKGHREILNTEKIYYIQLTIINEIVERLGGKKEIMKNDNGYTITICLPME